MKLPRSSHFAWILGFAFVSACSSAAPVAGDQTVPPPGATTDPKPGDGNAQDGPAATNDPTTGLPASVPNCAIDLKPELAALAVPGLSAGLIKNGKLVCTSVAGLANIAENRPVTPDTVFAWASVSKTVTAVTLMTLFDEGKFKLDDDVNGSLPFQVRSPRCASTPITFRHLLTHTSSIIEDEDDDNGVYLGSYVQGDSPVPLGDFLRGYLVPGGAMFKTGNFDRGCPGTKAIYSNVGAGLSGFLAERIAGTSFDELAAARVFKPLGMNETSFRLKSFEVTHVAMPYEGDSASTFQPHGHIGFPTYPDGLLRSSVPQLARFLSMFMLGGELDGKRILQKSTADEMRRIQIPNVDPKQGLIWFETAFGSRRVFGHDGSDPGTASNMFFDPTTNTGVLLVANGEWNEDASVALMIKLFDEAAK